MIEIALRLGEALSTRECRDRWERAKGLSPGNVWIAPNGDVATDNFSGAASD